MFVELSCLREQLTGKQIHTYINFHNKKDKVTVEILVVWDKNLEGFMLAVYTSIILGSVTQCACVNDYVVILCGIMHCLCVTNRIPFTHLRTILVNMSLALVMFAVDLVS